MDELVCLKCGKEMPYDWAPCLNCGWKAPESWEESEEEPFERPSAPQGRSQDGTPASKYAVLTKSKPLNWIKVTILILLIATLSGLIWMLLDFFR
jgi:hypothetical protein